MNFLRKQRKEKTTQGRGEPAAFVSWFVVLRKIYRFHGAALSLKLFLAYNN